MVIGFRNSFLRNRHHEHGLSFISDLCLFFKSDVTAIGKHSEQVFGGAVISALLQSSSVTIGLSQNLYALGSIHLKAAISITPWRKHRHDGC